MDQQAGQRPARSPECEWSEEVARREPLEAVGRGYVAVQGRSGLYAVTARNALHRGGLPAGGCFLPFRPGPSDPQASLTGAAGGCCMNELFDR